MFKKLLLGLIIAVVNGILKLTPFTLQMAK